jgi:riboflavin kinase / FMN adenylyltransferase
MKLTRNLNHPLEFYHPISLTIGNFDGVHRGHQAILSKLKERVLAENGQACVLSFENHPSEVLRKGASVPLLCSVKHKIKLLEEQGIDKLILLMFSETIAQQTAEEFLTSLQTIYHFDYLILGYDAVLGRNREGNSFQIQQLSKRNNFQVEYVSAQLIHQMIISSSKIRDLIKVGNLKLVEKCLGRKYSIYNSILSIENNPENLEQSIFNVDIDKLCLPPLGSYKIQIIHREKVFEGSAKIMKTYQDNPSFKLDARLVVSKTNLAVGDVIEVIFL